jgi:hypothetical protein
MRHLCLHAAGNMRANAVRFLHIHEIALLARRLSTSDWRELLGDGAGRTSAWWMYPSLALASNYLPGSIPPRLLAEFRAVCPSRLRRRYQRMSLYEVSWSNVRIAALPGLEWARSLGETWRFARSRAWPDRTAIDELALASVAQPALTSIRWYGASHAERIVRWVFTRPPRVQTMVSVRAAIAGGTRAMPGADT